MMRKIARSIIPVWFSAAILIFSVHDNLAYAKQTRTSVACGNAIKQQCSGVPVQANKFSSAFKTTKTNFPKDAVHWRSMLSAHATATVIETQPLHERTDRDRSSG